MLDNLAFSLNIMLPLYLLIVLGIWLRHKQILTDEVRSKLTKLVFNYALFSKIFLDMSAMDLSTFEWKYCLYAAGSTLVCFFGGWLFFRLTMKDPMEICACTHGSFRGNFAYVGLPVIANVLGTSTTCSAALMILSTTMPIYNTLGVVILSYYDPSGKKVSVTGMIRKILTNPIILAVILGIPFSFLHISIPYFANKALSNMGSIAGPLALLLIGSGLKLDTFKSKPIGILLTTALKTVINPLIFTIIAILIGFNAEEIVAVYVLHAVPTATNSYIMAKDMGGDADLAAGIIMVTSMVSIFTMTIGIFILKTIGII